MIIDEKIRCLKDKGFIDITDKLFKEIKDENMELFNSLSKSIEGLKRRGRHPILVYIDSKTLINVYSREYIENTNIETMLMRNEKLKSIILV